MFTCHFVNPGLRVEIILIKKEDNRKWGIDFKIVEQKK